MIIPYCRQFIHKPRIIKILVAENKSKLSCKLIFLLKKLWLFNFTLDSIKFISVFMQKRKNGLFLNFPLLLVFIRHIHKLIGLVINKLELSQSFSLVDVKHLNFSSFMKLLSYTLVALKPSKLFNGQ